jgi:hypothetical protein
MTEVVRKEEQVPEWKRYFSYQSGPPKGLYEMDYSDFKHAGFDILIAWEEYQCAEHNCRYEIRLYQKSLLCLTSIEERLINDLILWVLLNYNLCGDFGRNWLAIINDIVTARPAILGKMLSLSQIGKLLIEE